MCASTETDVRESVSDCTLASGEGLSSGGETSHPMSLKRPCPHPGNALYYMYTLDANATPKEHSLHYRLGLSCMKLLKGLLSDF
jgi:hypothetical protein